MFLKHNIRYPDESLAQATIIYPHPITIIDDDNFDQFLRGHGNFDVIIDGENIIYSRHSSLNDIIDEINTDFKNIWNKSKNIWNKSKNICPSIVPNILVISRHHETKYKKKKNNTNVKYYLVKSHQNDDLYLIHSFYNQQVKYVITNDKYGDHIDHLKLSGHLTDRLVTYQNNKLNWCLPYSDVYFNDV